MYSLRLPLITIPRTCTRRIMTAHLAVAEELKSWRSGIQSSGWIHMNAAGASPTSDATHGKMVSFLDQERQIGGYGAAAQHKKDGGRDARDAVAQLLGCEADEVALTESAQAAWARAFYSLRFRSGDYIFCWESEYAGNAVAFLQAAQRIPGINLQVLPLRKDGVVDIDALRRGLAGVPSGSRALVALTHVQTNSSVIQPATEVGQIAKEYAATFLLDACQSIGQLPVDVRALQCDFACGTGRKWLRGPRGTGFLFARRGAMPSSDDLDSGRGGIFGEPAMIDHVSVEWTSRMSYRLSSGAQRFEMWESAEAARAGLAVAVDECWGIGPHRIHSLSVALARKLRSGLATIPGVVICDAPSSFNETDNARCAIVTFEAFSELGFDSACIKDALADKRIAVSVSPSCHTFDDAEWQRSPTVRLSPSYFNTDEEVDIVLDALREILTKSRKRKLDVDA